MMQSVVVVFFYKRIPALDFSFKYGVRACKYIGAAVGWNSFTMHCNREFILRDKQAGFRQDGWRDETVEREGQHSRGAALFKHYQNSIFTVYTNRLTSIQLRINKCIFHSVSAFDTLIRAEINIPAEKSILLPLPSQLIAISAVLVEQLSVARVCAPGYWPHSSHNSTNEAMPKERGPLIWNDRLTLHLCVKSWSVFFKLDPTQNPFPLFCLLPPPFALHFSPAFVLDPHPVSPLHHVCLSLPFSYLGLCVATVTDLRERSCWFEAAGGAARPRDLNESPVRTCWRATCGARA